MKNVEPLDKALIERAWRKRRKIHHRSRRENIIIGWNPKPSPLVCSEPPLVLSVRPGAAPPAVIPALMDFLLMSSINPCEKVRKKVKKSLRRDGDFFLCWLWCADLAWQVHHTAHGSRLTLWSSAPESALGRSAKFRCLNVSWNEEKGSEVLESWWRWRRDGDGDGGRNAESARFIKLASQPQRLHFLFLRHVTSQLPLAPSVPTWPLRCT